MRSGNTGGKREPDGARGVNSDWASALVGCAFAPLTLASVAGVGAVRIMEMMGWVALAAASTGSSNEGRRSRLAVGGGVGSEARKGSFENWERGNVGGSEGSSASMRVSRPKGKT